MVKAKRFGRIISLLMAIAVLFTVVFANNANEIKAEAAKRFALTELLHMWKRNSECPTEQLLSDVLRLLILQCVRAAAAVRLRVLRELWTLTAL